MLDKEALKQLPECHDTLNTSKWVFITNVKGTFFGMSEYIYYSIFTTVYLLHRVMFITT